jgi:cytohesin
MIDKALGQRLREELRQGKAEAALLLLERHPELADAFLSLVPPGGHDPVDRVIHLVVGYRGVVPVLRRLLDHGVPVDVRGRELRTPLHVAAWSGNAEVMPLLLERGADLEARDADGLTPLDLTHHAWTPEAFDYLLARGAEPGLFVAMARGRMDLVEDLARTRTAERLRERLPDPGLLSVVVDTGPVADVERKRAILARLGLGAGEPSADVSLAQFLGALNDGDIAKALWWLDRHPDLAQASVPVDIPPGRPSPLVQVVVSSPGAEPVLHWLLSHGVPVDVPDHERRTPLHRAAWSGNVEAMRLLLERGADLEARDAGGLTPLDLTYHTGNRAAFEFLLSRGAEPALFVAMAFDRMDLVEDLLRTRTPDQLRERLPHRDVVRAVARKGPDAERKRAILRDLGVGD